ncbi:hypothetical protein BKA64DRAFT_464426 [Cadophora sp. MPI-SDFR-AT-0126]|nr:hypothetical protein BKA64DRAFT_464426 [Leotiomycetes sp. MPI-SDFR-AT-0126]
MDKMNGMGLLCTSTRLHWSIVGLIVLLCLADEHVAVLFEKGMRWSLWRFIVVCLSASYALWYLAKEKDKGDCLSTSGLLFNALFYDMRS